MSFAISIENNSQLADNPLYQKQELLEKLPNSCRIPGYWETLASNTDDWAPLITASRFWRAANTELEGWNKEYRREHGGLLYKHKELPPFVGKSLHRIKEKTIEKIKRAPEHEMEIKRLFDSKAPVPRLEDLVRVRLETQFLDGVPFLAKKITELALSNEIEINVEPKGKIDGYFAQHINLKLPVFFVLNKESTNYNLTVEIQIATSLATMVWENSHALYEGTRTKQEKSEDWQWNPNDPRFLSRQLGHMIHLADGLFCNLRDRGSKLDGK